MAYGSAWISKFYSEGMCLTNFADSPLKMINYIITSFD